MPRANRNFVPGLVWHITHRCHKKEFLLKFRRDKMLWIGWMHEAKRRFGLVILNFMITSNHVHLMATAMAGRAEAASRPISLAMQLAHSRVAQLYNLRKDRRGAFWEDRFHATAIETGAQLARCLTYVDMNMVRAGVAGHPRDWEFCGYREMAQPDHRPRLRLVDADALADLTGAHDPGSLLQLRDEWIEQAIRKGRYEREPLWTESIAVGGEDFLKRVSGDLGGRAGAAGIVRAGESFALWRARPSSILAPSEPLGLKTCASLPGAGGRIASRSTPEDEPSRSITTRSSGPERRAS